MNLNFHAMAGEVCYGCLFCETVAPKVTAIYLTIIAFFNIYMEAFFIDVYLFVFWKLLSLKGDNVKIGEKVLWEKLRRKAFKKVFWGCLILGHVYLLVVFESPKVRQILDIGKSSAISLNFEMEQIT